MTGGRFFPKLNVNRSGIVEAKGPLDHMSDQVVEMCVWVYQRSANGSDAIANNMQDGPAMKAKAKMGGSRMGTAKPETTLKISPGVGQQQPTWSLDLDDRMNKKGKFAAGSATAVAIGVFLDENNEERLFLWSEPVELDGPGAKPAPAQPAPAKPAPAKRAPAKRASPKR